MGEGKVRGKIPGSRRVPNPVLVTVLAGSLCAASAVKAITPSQADQAMQAFNKAYWNPTDKYFYKSDNRTGVLDFWLSAHAWETVMDAYRLTDKDEYKQQIKDVYDGFVKRHGTDWTQNDYNDDIMWWTIASTRAYAITGEARYLTQAKTQFDWVYKTQRDTVAGGIWWKNTEHNTKNSCVVQPAILTAIALSKALKDDGYRVKAESLYAWQKRTLLDAKNPGKVFDAINSSGVIGTGSTTYNQGTFIGSAMGLGHVEDAKICADWTKKNMCNPLGVLREAGQGDFAAFKLILVRYVIGMGRELGWAGTPYLSWMETNAVSVWEKRRTADNVMGPDWANPAPATGIESATAASGVTLLALLATPGTAIRLVPTDRAAYAGSARTAVAGMPSIWVWGAEPNSAAFDGGGFRSGAFRRMDGRLLNACR